MFVKYDKNGGIESLFVGCMPDVMDGYKEIPDDDAIVAEYIASHRPVPEQPEGTADERIAALEEQLAAAKILLGVE